MKVIGPDRTFIDYWQSVVIGITNRFGIRVWADHFSVIDKFAVDDPRLVDGDFAIPVLPGTTLPVLISTLINDHAVKHNSDLIEVLVGEKSFNQALMA